MFSCQLVALSDQDEGLIRQLHELVHQDYLNQRKQVTRPELANLSEQLQA